MPSFCQVLSAVRPACTRRKVVCWSVLNAASAGVEGHLKVLGFQSVAMQ